MLVIGEFNITKVVCDRAPFLFDSIKILNASTLILAAKWG